MKWFARIGAGVVVAYVAALGVIYVVQRKVMYFPEYTTRVSPSSFPELAGVREVELKTRDSVKIFARYSPPPAGRPTVIYFHGNHHTLRSQRGRCFMRSCEKINEKSRRALNRSLALA